MIERLKKFIKNNHPTYQTLISHFEGEDISSSLLFLEENGDINKVKDRFYLSSELNLVPGTIISIKDRFSFASVGEDEDVYIDNSSLKGALLGDRVLLKKISFYGQKDEFEVNKIVKRNVTEVVGEVIIIKGVYTLSVDKVAPRDFMFIIDLNDIVISNHQIVRCLIKKINSKHAVLTPLEVLGNKSDVGVDVARIIIGNGAPLNFPLEVEEEIKYIPEEVSDLDKVGREDFTDHLIVTIDGEDAKDFDDAVEVVKVEDVYYVGVHIADVSNYVKEGSAIDKEALNRATSLYVRDRVIPMLPFELSNGICSLNPNVDRLVTSCLFSIDEQGNILSTHICKGIINSKHRLTYSYVNEFLNNIRHNKTSYTDLEKMIISLKEVSDIIRKKRDKKGGLELSSTELIFDIDENGNPLDVKKRKQDVGERLIEDLMICANEIVSSTLEKLKLPSIYRIHEKPKAKKIQSFQLLTKYKGYPFFTDPLNVTPKDVSNYLSLINDDIDKKVLSNLLLRCLAKAKYSLENKRHFGLASSSYTHFTSPIRRYPDLIIHRLIDRYLVKKDLDINAEFQNKLSLYASLSSTRERRALSIERTVEDLLSAKYMNKHLGDEYEAIVVSMTTQGMFVELDNGIQGFIPFESIGGDYYVFDESTYTAYGVRKGKQYNLGDVVNVICSNVDMDKYQVTFVLRTNVKNNKIKSRTRKENNNGKRNRR